MKTPGIIEYGRWPAARDGTRRRADALAKKLWEAIPGCALVTLQVQRPVDEWDEMVAWACLNLRGSGKGKVPERRIPGVVALSAPEGVEEVERQLVELLVADLLEAHAGPTRESAVLRSAPGRRGPRSEEPDPSAPPRLRVLPGASARRRASDDAARGDAAGESQEEAEESRGPFLRVLPGGLDPRA